MWHNGSWIWIPTLDFLTMATFLRNFQKLVLSPILRRCKYGVANFLTLTAMTHIMRPYKGHCGFRRMHLKGWKTITKLLLFHIHLARLTWVRPFIGNIKALTTQPRVCTCSSKYIASSRFYFFFTILLEEMLSEKRNQMYLISYTCVLDHIICSLITLRNRPKPK